MLTCRNSGARWRSCNSNGLSIEETRRRCCRFEVSAIYFTPSLSSRICINEYLATDRGEHVNEQSLRNCSGAKTFPRSRVFVGMNRSTSGWSVKRFERSYRLDTTLII